MRRNSKRRWVACVCLVVLLVMWACPVLAEEDASVVERELSVAHSKEAPRQIDRAPKEGRWFPLVVVLLLALVVSIFFAAWRYSGGHR